MKITSFVIGMGAGAAIAMLFAPRSGDETREMIAKRAREGSRYAKERAREFRDLATDAAAAGKEVVACAADAGKDVIKRQKNAVTAAVEAARDTYNRESQPS